MTPSAVTADLIQHVRLSNAHSQVSHPTPSRRAGTVINQPLSVVLAHMRSTVHGKEGQTAESDPTLTVVHPSWGRHVCVRYTLYELPGGAQVTASIESVSHTRLDPLTVIAVRVVSRRIATDLSTMRDDLE